MTEFEIREFFTLSAEDLRAIRVDSNKKSRLALALQVGFLRMTGAALDTYEYIPRAVLVSGTVSILGVRCHKARTWTASDLRRNRGYHSRNRASSFPSSTAQRT